jgi:hypothetical protein
MSTVQDDLWPDELRTTEVLSPKEILTGQTAALEAKTNGLLKASIDEKAAEDRRILRFVVSSPRVDQKLVLFEVHLYRDLEYPAAIIPPDLKLPNFLKREYYEPGMKDITNAIGASTFRTVLESEGQWVKNNQVADSPAEFKHRLQELFSSPAVKSLLISMLAKATQTAA